MDRGGSSAAYVLRAGVILVWSALLAACSQAPPEPAPVFALPLSKIVGARPNSQDPPLTAASPPTRQLRYVAVPPGRSVAGMAHAHLVLKQPTAPHRSAPPQKKIIAQAKTVRAPGAETREGHDRAAGERCASCDDPAGRARGGETDIEPVAASGLAAGSIAADVGAEDKVRGLSHELTRHDDAFPPRQTVIAADPHVADGNAEAGAAIAVATA